MRGEIEQKITFYLTKEEKEVLEKAKDILFDMRDEADNIDSDYFYEVSDTLYDIVKDIKSTDDSDIYTYVFEELW